MGFNVKTFLFIAGAVGVAGFVSALIGGWAANAKKRMAATANTTATTNGTTATA